MRRAPCPTTLIFTINIAGEFRDSLGRTIRDLYGCPHVVWHTDYILSKNADRVRGTPKSTAMLVGSIRPRSTPCALIYGQDRFDHLAFFPHPAVGAPAPDDATVAEFVERRPIGVLWSGGFQKPETPWSAVEGPAKALLQEALDLALSVEWAPPHEALDHVLASRGLDLADPSIQGAREAAALVDVEVRMTRRFAFLKAVAATGLPLHIVGAGWDEQLHHFKHATYEGPVEMTRMAEFLPMTQSRVVLNTNGNFGAGSHERPFSASLAGAATFSDFSRYYGQVFEPGTSIELFHWKDLAGGMAQLASPGRRPGAGFRDGAQRQGPDDRRPHLGLRRIDLILGAAEAVRNV